IRLAYQDGAQRVMLNDEDVSDAIRTPEIAHYASKVSAVPEVRQFLLDVQRDMAKKGNILMGGRDIGTVILPDAPVRILLTASAETRAERRYRELAEKGLQVTREGVLHDIVERDRPDRTRAVAPLRQPQDGVVHDTSTMTLDESSEAVLQINRQKTEEETHERKGPSLRPVDGGAVRGAGVPYLRRIQGDRAGEQPWRRLCHL